MRIALLPYRSILYGSTYGTIGLIDMDTVTESAGLLYILKIRYTFRQLCDIHRSEIHRGKSGCIRHPAAGNLMQLTMPCCMLSSPQSLTDFLCLQMKGGIYAI